MVKNPRNKEKKVVAGSVRARILKEIRDGQTRRFKDLKEKLHLYDIVLDRALKELINKYGYIVKTGSGKGTRYAINQTNIDKMKEIEEVLQELDATPEPDSMFYPVDIDLNSISSEVAKYENEDDTNLAFTVPHLNIVIAGEKIDGFEDSGKNFGNNHEAIKAIALLMSRIQLSRATQKQQNTRAEMEKEGKDTEEIELKSFYANAEVFEQEFKLIISWRPERYGSLVSCTLPDNWFDTDNYMRKLAKKPGKTPQQLAEPPSGWFKISEGVFSSRNPNRG